VQRFQKHCTPSVGNEASSQGCPGSALGRQIERFDFDEDSARHNGRSLRNTRTRARGNRTGTRHLCCPRWSTRRDECDGD